MFRLVLHAGSLLWLLLAAGCATTQRRIERNAELFATFSPEVQRDVEAGVVRLGFTPDMVLLAVGRPSHVQNRLEESGSITVWRYTAYRWRSRGAGWPYRCGPWWHDPFQWEECQEYDVLRVEFRDGEVVALESMER